MNIYISHIYQNKEENKIDIEKIIEKLVKEHPEHTYISPVHCFGFLYSKTSYEQGLAMCLDLLSKCNYMYVYGDYQNSRGCKTEIEFCKEHRIPYIIFDNNGYSTFSSSWF